MNAKTAILAAALVALGAISAYLGNQVNRTREELAVLRASFDAAEADRTAQVQATGVRLDAITANISAQAETIALLGSPEQIAGLVVADRFPLLVEAIATALTEDPAKAAMLRGEQGPAPDLAELVEAFYESGLVQFVSESIWQTRNGELAAMPGTIANVAAEVFETYGESLRGKTTSAEDVAASLALDPGFVGLVQLELAKGAGTP